VTKNYLIQKTPLYKAGKFAAVLALASAASFGVAGCNQNSGGPVTVAPDSTGGGGGAVVTVNDQPVERNALYTHMEANYGENSLRQLIDFALITQKLKAEGLSVSDAEVDAAIEARKDSSPEVAMIVESGGVRLNALKRQTRYQLALDKLLTKDIKVTDDQLKKWFETRRKYYDQPAKAKVGILLSSTKTRADTMSAQLKSKSKSFLELVNEQKNAKDPAGAASLAETPTMISTDGLPPLLKNTIDKLKAGENSGVVEMKEGPQTAYAILRAVQKQPAVKADFAKLKPQLEMDYKLEQVARDLNKENPANPPFDQTLEQVAGAVAAQSGGQPTFREILTFITQTAATNLTTKLRNEAKIVANDKTYEKLVESYKPAETATSADNAAPAGNSAPAGNAAP
jgi:foldase protein PrsA